jgi:transaldolase
MYNENINFALWCDFVERSFLDGEFRDLLCNGTINGATSNPAIFKSAFLSSPAYEEDKTALSSKTPKDIYEHMAIKDISKAADIMVENFSSGDDGFISIEVDPNFCDDANSTYEEGKRLYDAIGKKNVMIKVPATNAGYEAIEMLMSEGINVNATLIFSKEQARRSLEAMQKGSANSHESCMPKGVISIFVSRFDRLLDDSLKEKGLTSGKVGIYNALDIYDMISSSKQPNVRALFASTGVKGGEYPKSYYITELLVPNSINTAPLDTIKAFVETKVCTSANRPTSEEIGEFFETLKSNDINMDEVCKELLNDGLKAFKVAFKEILESLK